MEFSLFGFLVSIAVAIANLFALCNIKYGVRLLRKGSESSNAFELIDSGISLLVILAWLAVAGVVISNLKAIGILQL
ncbi:hypothetical protein CCB80_04940 [Armatimonadetes bacterium Uphvl-Ar1]|nr:hypothetical protein CCB80_04940 [Armatimonadetes bacterium Uphvl-Ar1]